jgi:hypothetical protein
MKIKVEHVAKKVMTARARKAHAKRLDEAVSNIVCWLDELEDPFDVAMVLATVKMETEAFTGVTEDDLNRAALVLRAKQSPAN